MPLSNKQQYFALQADLEALEKTTGAYLADQSVDAENVFEGKPQEERQAFWNNWLPDNSPLWLELVRAAGMAAGMRGEEAGLDINALMGRGIY